MPGAGRIEIGYEETDPAGATIENPESGNSSSFGVKLSELAILPAPVDNVAVAITNISGGTQVLMPSTGRTHTVPFTVLEGHRLAAGPIKQGEPLLSWGLTFAHATTDIAAGEYVCNDSIIATLRLRNVTFELPPAGNFMDHIKEYVFDPATFVCADPIARAASQVPRIAAIGCERCLCCLVGAHCCHLMSCESAYSWLTLLVFCSKLLKGLRGAEVAGRELGTT